MRGSERGDQVDAVVIYFPEADYNITQVDGIRGLVMQMQMRQTFSYTEATRQNFGWKPCFIHTLASTCGKDMHVFALRTRTARVPSRTDRKLSFNGVTIHLQFKRSLPTRNGITPNSRGRRVTGNGDRGKKGTGKRERERERGRAIVSGPKAGDRRRR